jgi:hypothetical protein
MMNALLSALNVPVEVQQFFNADELLFNYGGHYEQYDTGFHRVPTTTHLWLAGNSLSKTVILTSSAMEAIAYLTINRYKFSNLRDVTFMALGNLPSTGQLKWIRDTFRKRKFILVFGNDLLGRMADIRVAAGLRNKPVAFHYTAFRIGVKCRRVLYEFDIDQLSLNAFEKATAIRTGCRTDKPKKFTSFLDQLKHDANP